MTTLHLVRLNYRYENGKIKDEYRVDNLRTERKGLPVGKGVRQTPKDVQGQ